MRARIEQKTTETCMAMEKENFPNNTNRFSRQQNHSFYKINICAVKSFTRTYTLFNTLPPKSHCFQFLQFLSHNTTHYFIPRLPGNFPVEPGEKIFENGTFPGKQSKLPFTPGSYPLLQGRLPGKPDFFPASRDICPFCRECVPCRGAGFPATPACCSATRVLKHKIMIMNN